MMLFVIIANDIIANKPTNATGIKLEKNNFGDIEIFLSFNFILLPYE